MKTIIQGKNLKTTYGVDHKWMTIKDDKNEDITVYTGKPELTKKTEITNWETIKSFDEKIEFNSKSNKGWLITFDYKLGYINLSEDEAVGVVERITRIDLDAYVIHTDKVLNETEVLKEESEEILECQIKAFNKMMIESNNGLLAYCKLHKLNPEETDVDELFKVVYSKQLYRIEDGKLLVNNNATIKANDFVYGGVAIGNYGVLTSTDVISATSICNAR